MGRLWIMVGSIVTVAALGATTYNIVSLIAHEEVTETTTFDATGLRSIRLHNDQGSVEVVGEDVDEITVVADISHGLTRTRTRAEIDGVRLVLDADCPSGLGTWCSVAYRIVVPVGLDVDVENENGHITLRDLDGDVLVDGNAGGIDLARLGGNVDVDTREGGVRASGLRGDTVRARAEEGSVRLSFAEAPTTVTASTSNGAVEVVVPDDGATYRVGADNFVGAIDTAVRTDPSSDRTIVAETDTGSITVRYPTG